MTKYVGGEGDQKIFDDVICERSLILLDNKISLNRVHFDSNIIIEFEN